MYINRNLVQRIKAQYPPKTRLLLIKMNDPYRPVEPGTRGAVKLIDDEGQIHMVWDNGRTLALVPEVDAFRKLTQEELKNEKEKL